MPFLVNVVLVTQLAYTTVAVKDSAIAIIIFFISNSVSEKEKYNNNNSRSNTSSIASSFKRLANQGVL